MSGLALEAARWQPSAGNRQEGGSLRVLHPAGTSRMPQAPILCQRPPAQGKAQSGRVHSRKEFGSIWGRGGSRIPQVPEHGQSCREVPAEGSGDPSQAGTQETHELSAGYQRPPSAAQGHGFLP